MPAYYRGAGTGPGAAPGIEHHELAALPSGPGNVHVTCMDYCSSQFVEQQIDDLEEFVGRHRPDWVAVRWIDVDGLSDVGVVHTFATKYELHPLAVEDLHDHVAQIIEIIEIYRERASDLYDGYMSAVSNRMNQIMKVLTVISTIFIPLTFLAGVYGMNLRNFPELDLPWAYPLFGVICVVLAAGLVIFFRRREWL